MTRLRAISRRTVAVVVGALLGLAGATAMALPAGAQHGAVSGACTWDATNDQWLVTWTVTSTAPDGVDTYRLAEVTATPADSTLDGIEVTDPAAGFPYDAHAPLGGAQRLSEGTADASLTVVIEWDNGQTDTAHGEVDLAADCAAPAPPTELGQWRVDCQALTITIDNDTAESVALTFAPSTGEPVDVEVAGGESATVRFPTSPGLSVDVLAGGRSIVDPADPITVTQAQWDELGCADDTDGQGGGGLPATGSPVALIIAGAVALLALGGGLFLVARRRRIIFTAQ